MRKVSLVVLTLLLIGGTALAAVKSYSLTVKGLHCEKCVPNIQKALKKVEGVSDVQADVEKKIVQLKLDDSKASLDQVKKVLADVGYEVKEVKEVQK